MTILIQNNSPEGNEMLEDYKNLITTTTHMCIDILDTNISNDYDLDATKKILGRFVAVGIHDLLTIYDGLLDINLYDIQTDELDKHIDVVRLTAVGIRLKEIVTNCTKKYLAGEVSDDLNGLVTFINSDEEGSLENLMGIIGEENRYKIDGERSVYFNPNFLRRFGISFKSHDEG